MDVETQFLLSASSDSTVKLWDVETGRALFSYKHQVPVRSVSFSASQDRFVAATDNVLHNFAGVHVHSVDRTDPLNQRPEPLHSFFSEKSGKIVKALWGPCDRILFTVGDAARVEIWDSVTGQALHVIEDHTKAINDIEFSRDGSFFLTASSDFTTRLYDSRSYTPIKTYTTGRPCNGASFSPIMNHVLIGGGQAASEVTGTKVDPAQFATRIYHKIYAEEMGMIPGHFGTVNAVKFSPTGKQFATGGEDGFIRLNSLDDTYFKGLSDDTWVKALADRLFDA